MGEEDRPVPERHVEPEGLARPFCTNIDSNADPSTISGTAIARKITKFVRARPLNRYRPSTSPIKAPMAVAMMAAGIATVIEISSAWFSPGTRRFSRQ